MIIVVASRRVTTTATESADNAERRMTTTSADDNGREELTFTVPPDVGLRAARRSTVVLLRVKNGHGRGLLATVEAFGRLSPAFEFRRDRGVAVADVRLRHAAAVRGG